MEPALVVSVALVVLVGGSVALLSRQRMFPWSLPALKTSSGTGATDNELEPTGTRSPAPDEMIEPPPAPATSIAVVRPSIVDRTPAPSVEERRQMPEPVRLDVVPNPSETLEARLDRFEAQLDAIGRAVDRQAAEIGQELRRVRSEVYDRTEADETRRVAALERLRADLLAAVSRAAAEGSSRTGTRRPDVSAELYARLARLEAALAAVTNPILLPGEAYAPPTELLPEALVWENWNEVGERAFSLADAYSAQRLHLSYETRGEVDEFVTRLRTLLTRSVYPNLQPEPDAVQQAALRVALEEIAAELSRVRQKLEWEYREGRSI